MSLPLHSSPTRSIQAACAPSQSQQEPNDASDLEQVSENEEAPGSDDDDDEDAGSDSVEEDQDQPPIEDSQGPSDEPTCDAVDSFDYAGAWDDAPDESPSDNNGELVGEVGDVPLSQPSPDEGELHDHDVVTIEESPMKSVEDMQAQRAEIEAKISELSAQLSTARKMATARTLVLFEWGYQQLLGNSLVGGWHKSL